MTRSSRHASPKGSRDRRAVRGARGAWKLEDAKARFSELVRCVRQDGPQSVTVRGEPAVVVVDAAEYARLTSRKPDLPLVGFLERLDLGGLDLEREPDVGREVDL